MFLRQGTIWTLLSIAVTSIAKPPGEKPPFDLWNSKYAGGMFNYDLPWNAWKLTKASFNASNSTTGNSTTPPAVPSGMDMKLMQKLTSDLGHNQACSPYLLGQVMSQVWLAAEGTTRNELTPVLGLTTPSPGDFLNAYKAAIKYLSSPSENITAAAFGRVYIQERYPVFPSYTSALFNYYLTSERSFSSPSSAAAEINNDVSNVTNNHINDLVSKRDLENASLVLISALYFNAPWKYSFTSVKKAPFLTAAGDQQVDMMALSDVTLPYAKMKTFDVIALPYSDDNYSMLLLRPLARSMEAVAALRNSLNTVNITDVIGKLESTPHKDFVVKMPKFVIETDYDLKQTMRALGIKEIFLPGANFGGVTKDRDLHVGQIKHKVFINVTEEGTETAAAGAAVQDLARSAPSPLSFDVDRPFFAIVYNKLHHINLLTAFVASPRVS